jgi:hypothetical protein
MKWPDLERAWRFARVWLPYLYAFGAAAIFVTLLFDARLRPKAQVLIHAAFALCFAFAFWRMVPYLTWQLDSLDSSIRFAQEQQVKNR